MQEAKADMTSYVSYLVPCMRHNPSHQASAMHRMLGFVAFTISVWCFKSAFRASSPIIAANGCTETMR